MLKRAMSVGGAQALEMALQLVLPVVLVRLLTPEDFGLYRLVWLVVLTLTSLVSFAWVDSLFYFLPRAQQEERRAYVRQTEGVLLVGAVLACAVFYLAGRWMPASMAAAVHLGPWLAVMVVLWTWGQVLDQLPTVDERIRWQVGALVFLSFARMGAAVWAAWMWGNVHAVLVALALLSGLKVVLQQIYVYKFHPPGAPLWNRQRLRDQAGQAIPFGIGGLLFTMRSRIEQWIVAAMFLPTQFAAFSVASVVAPLIMVARRAVSFVLLPRMSRDQSAGDMAAVLALNNQVNVSIASVLFPVLSFVLFFADALVELVYTRSLLEAAPVMRILVLTWAVQVVDLNSLSLLLSQGRFVSWLNLVLIALCVPISWLGAQAWGLPGAVAGSTAAILIERVMLIRRLARETGVPARRLQHWRRLGAVLVVAVVCGALAWQVGERCCEAMAPAARLLLGGGLGLVLYLPCFLWFRRAGWLGISAERVQ